MDESGKKMTRIALVYGTVPSIEEIDQYASVNRENLTVEIVTSASIAQYFEQSSMFHGLAIHALPDYDDSPNYLPGLDDALASYDCVIVKERLGLYAFQVIKAKQKHGFRLIVAVDNGEVFAGNDIEQMRVCREEITQAADAFYVHTKAAAELLREEGVKSPIHIVPPFVNERVQRDRSTRARALQKLRVGEADKVCAYIGPVEWEANLSLLFRAVAQLKSAGETWSVLICGVGAEDTGHHRLVAQWGLQEQVVFIDPNRGALSLVYAAADCVYYGPTSHRDRCDLDVFRLLAPMANSIPIVATRGVLVEEICGKHRIDFCPQSSRGLLAALQKTQAAKGVVKDVVNKNKATLAQRFTEEKFVLKFNSLINEVSLIPALPPSRNVDAEIEKIEGEIIAARYVPAVDMIQSLLDTPNLNVLHTSTLYRQIGDCFTKLGDILEGKKAYQISLSLQVSNDRALTGLGTIALLNQEYDSSVMHFQKAISLAPQSDKAMLGLGLAFQGLGELQEAGRWIKKSLELCPTSETAIYVLVKLSYVRNQYVDAVHAVERYMRFVGETSEMLFTLGGLYYRMGELNLAINTTDKILEKQPNHSNALALREKCRNQTSDSHKSSVSA